MGEHRFGRAFGQNLVFVVRRFDNDRHHFARKVERGSLIDFFIIVNTHLLMRLWMAQDGAVENIFQARLKMADEVRVK